MVNVCSAYGCVNRSSHPNCKEKGISFHHFPLNDQQKLKMWIEKMKRKSFKPTKHSRICSQHFVEEDFEYETFTNRRLLKKTAVPKIFCFTNKTNAQTRPRTSYEFGSGIIQTENCSPAQASSNEVSTQTDENLLPLLLQELETMKTENAVLKSNLKETELTPENLDDYSMNILTGFSRNQFHTIYLFLSSIEKQKLFLFFVRLKTGMTESMMGLFFKKSQSSMSRIVTSVTASIYYKIASVGIWPDKNMVLENMPYIFRLNFPQCRVIIDCTEFVIQKPSDPKEQQLTFSNYKNANTVKCLIGISPSGGISFISEAWGGSVSDKELFLKCGILDILEPGDVILADRGFTIKAEVEAKGCKVITPGFLKDKIQFNIIERKENKKISRHRVHVERAICRIKQFKFFSSQIPYNSLHSISKLIYIAAFFTNFGNSLIKC
ncbi:THAP domain-containing protein 1 [Araneus ventricosus]|uniref:THAP domain-containing protein 1 n=1 Tax=Araneus ventricosus TaxID=182803 RepID=A0A4Y2USP1_ARAVE|nr:THAP domain-containing protein 1 [Araneus ventricosus]